MCALATKNSSQKHPNGFQIGVQRASESTVALEHPSGNQKDHFFLAGPPMEEATDTPKSSPRASRSIQKSILHGLYLVAPFFVRFGASEAKF